MHHCLRGDGRPCVWRYEESRPNYFASSLANRLAIIYVHISNYNIITV